MILLGLSILLLACGIANFILLGRIERNLKRSAGQARLIEEQWRQIEERRQRLALRNN